MPELADQIYRSADDIVADLISAMQARIPDINIGPDSIFRIWCEVFANSAEGLFLAQQLLHDDIFIQTANALALMRFGEMYGRPQKGGTLATGTVRFSGAGGTFIPSGTQVGSPRLALDDELLFNTTEDATIPNAGIPTAPVAAAHTGSGALTGTYEYGVTFTTSEGETDIGAISNALVISAKNVDLSAIPLGGTGTVGRKIYRRVNGGTFGLVATIANNSATTLSNDSNISPGSTPPDASTAEQVTVDAASDEASADYNVAINTIVDLVDVTDGVTDVLNLVAFTGGTDPEDIETFRSELLNFVRAPMSGSASDLIAWALTIDGVESVAIFPNENLAGAPTPGTVAIRIAGADGTVPDSDVVDAVQAELDSHDLINVTIVVGTFTPTTIDVDVTLTLSGTYVLGDVSAQAEQAVRDYINSIPVGGTVYLAGISAAIFGLAGIATVEVTDPATDTTTADDHKAVLGVFTPST